MKKHFMAVLGTSLYEPVIYRMPWEKGEDEAKILEKREHEFVQLAFLEGMREELKNGARATIFVTLDEVKEDGSVRYGSKSKNWNDREYEGREAKNAQNWLSNQKEKVIEHDVKKGMKTQIAELLGEVADCIEMVEIPDGKSEEEIKGIFKTIYHCIGEEEELIFDITHSFRSIPMIAVSVLNYAKVLKNCTIGAVYYGAYEAAEERKDINKKIVDIVDITYLNDILQWTSAADVFIKYGNAGPMNDLVKKKKDQLDYNEKKRFAPLESKIKSYKAFTDAIATCRGQNMDGGKPKKKENYSIKSAVEKVQLNSNEKALKVQNEMELLVPLVGKVEEKMEPFQVEENYKIGMAMVQWSIDHNMTQQGYTALEETVKTFLCHHYGIDETKEETRDRFMGNLINRMKDWKKEKKKTEGTAQERNEFYVKWMKEYHGETLEEQYQEIAKAFIYSVSYEFIDNISDLKDIRNDINHFGMRPNPKQTEDLQKKLVELKEKISRHMEDYRRKESLSMKKSN